MNKFMYDNNFVRYQLVKTNPGKSFFNWLFLPGGPGADSIYFLDLIEHLSIPGNFWLIDFPANGSNITETIGANYDFNNWQECLLPAIQRFENPIVVGHSFGGMFPLLFPALEKILKGFVILNSAPCLWLQEAAKLAGEKELPILLEPMSVFEKNPTQETFKNALIACAPYYFNKNNLAAGVDLLQKIPFNYYAAVWWLKKAKEINFSAQWIPEKVPTLIIGASDDCIVPITLFKSDPRFSRNNIKIETITEAGHFPWLEQPTIIQEKIKFFADKIQ